MKVHDWKEELAHWRHQRDLAQRKMTIRGQLVWVLIWLGAIVAAVMLTYGAHEMVSWVAGT